MASKGQILQLYRHTLKAASQFPSVKRLALIEDIKVEYREGRAVENEEEAKRRIAVGLRSLDQLRSFAGLDAKGQEWEVSLKGSCE
jgi:hypothetical protein